jgi:hypothetical protein
LILIQAVASRWNGVGVENRKSAIRALLKAYELRVDTAMPVSLHEVLRIASINTNIVAPGPPIDRVALNQALSFLTDDFDALIRRAGDSGGGLYVVGE